jgi:hypothetical protein
MNDSDRYDLAEASHYYELNEAVDAALGPSSIVHCRHPRRNLLSEVAATRASLFHSPILCHMVCSATSFLGCASLTIHLCRLNQWMRGKRCKRN